MRIGKVAVTAGCNIQTLRYYERRGLLKAPPRSPSGYRDYSSEAVRLIRFIKRAQGLGFTLEEVEELLNLRGGQRKRRGEVRAVAETKILDIEIKLARLQAMHRALSQLVASCASDQARPSCPILDALNEPDGNPAGDDGDGNGKV